MMERRGIPVSSEMDFSLRGFLMLDRAVQAVKERNQDIAADMLEAMIDDAVREVRAERRKQTTPH